MNVSQIRHVHKSHRLICKKCASQKGKSRILSSGSFDLTFKRDTAGDN